MAFSYHIALDRDLDQVRFAVRDTRENSGPLPIIDADLPSTTNFQDEEILRILPREGTWERAVAACFEALSAAWRLYPNIESDQFGLSRSHISGGFAQEAKKWREEFGYGGKPSSATAYSPVRVDAYSQTLTISGELDE